MFESKLYKEDGLWCSKDEFNKDDEKSDDHLIKNVIMLASYEENK